MPSGFRRHGDPEERFRGVELAERGGEKAAPEAAPPLKYRHNNFMNMLTLIAAILLILWFLGVIGVYTIGWFVHILLVAAIIMFLIRIIQGENPVK